MLHRIEVRSKPGHTNPKAASAQRDAEALGLAVLPTRVDQADVYLVEGEFDREQVQRLAEELLADPVTQQATIGSQPKSGDAYIEVQPLPGVMDPAAEAVRAAISAMLGIDANVQTGARFDMHGVDQSTADEIAARTLANTVIQAIHREPFLPDELPKGTSHEFKVIEVPIRDLSDAELESMSREAHLFLSLDEMRAIQEEYRELGREPHEIELETLAQTWSEHCVHKTLKANIRYREAQRTQGAHWMDGRPGHTVNDDGTVTINNLLKSTVAAATTELIEEGIDWCLSVFVDNAGIIAFDDEHAVCFKVETHNHPSAIEPYGGAATGIGGCIRDIIGTGLAAKPIAATDVFCVAYPDHFNTQSGAKDSAAQALPAGCLHPRRVLTQVVAGVRDYGNRMGIPTLNGAVWFDDRYVGNPLVYCGVVGVMPRDRIEGAPKSGDRIIAMGGRTGRDGIHGATFSSAELTDTHADEFSHAVQIGNAVTEKMLLDAILEARDSIDGCLYNAITDCGAGGFSSAVGEMGEKLGARVTLEKAPLKYEGLSPTEIWISEAQERMVLAVSPEKVSALHSICDKHDVEMCDLGQFGTEGAELVLTYRDTEVGRLPMAFLHDGLPKVEREAVWDEVVLVPQRTAAPVSANTQSLSIEETLLGLLSHPNIASKRWIIRQYDHEVQGNTVVKPIVGARGADGPSDAAVVTPVNGSKRGLAIGNGLATGWCSDPYVMTLAAIDECVRNLVCVGADPSRIAILDNFCWPSCKDPRNLGSLVRAAEGCYDGAKAYRTPFISGKDSLNNQFLTEDGRTIQIPPTLLISGFGIVDDIDQCVTMDAKRAGNVLVVIGKTGAELGGSHVISLNGAIASSVGDESQLFTLPRVDLNLGPRCADAVHQLIQRNVVHAAHDCSEGGLLVAAAEMAFAGDLGLRLDLNGLAGSGTGALYAMCFSESPSRYLLEMSSADLPALRDACGSDIPHAIIGWFDDSKQLRLVESGDTVLDAPIAHLRSAWLGTLNW